MATRILVLATKNENMGACWPQDFFLKVEHCKAENLSRITFLSMFMGSTSARLEPILALSFRIPEAASSLVKFIGRHRSLALAMLFAFRFSNFLSSFSLSESSRTHRYAHKQNSRRPKFNTT